MQAIRGGRSILREDLHRVCDRWGNGGRCAPDEKDRGKDIGVKAAGGIRTLSDALKMIEAGANRLGTSGSVAIIKQIENS